MRFSFAVLFSLMTFPVIAGDGVPAGIGSLSCTEWIFRGSVMTTKLEQESWVLGYAGSANAASSTNFLQNADVPAMLLFVDTYCAKDEDKKLIDAANALFDPLKGKPRSADGASRAVRA